MKRTLHTLSHTELTVDFPDEPRPCSWEELARLCDRPLLAADFQGQVCPFHYGFAGDEHSPYAQVKLGDSWVDVTKEQLEALFCCIFEVRVLGCWYEVETARKTCCLILDREDRTKLHTRNDDYLWGPSLTEIDRNQAEAVRMYTSESFLDRFFAK